LGSPERATVKIKTLQGPGFRGLFYCFRLFSPKCQRGFATAKIHSKKGDSHATRSREEAKFGAERRLFRGVPLPPAIAARRAEGLVMKKISR
jgi:hypothetical protein